MLDKIKEHQDVLHWNDKGQLLYETKPIPGSHLVDLVNDTLRHRKGFEPVGWSVFVLNVEIVLKTKQPEAETSLVYDVFIRVIRKESAS